MVTNPGTGEPTVLASAYATLHDISDGRMVMGIGRGDSARRYINQKPVPVKRFEEALRMIKPFMNGEKVQWNDTELELSWVRPELPPIEMYVAGYGPRALAVAGRVGDGVIIQLADPDIITWIMSTARAAAEEAGRDPAELKCIVCAPSHISGDMAAAREQVRWFPAMVSNHVRDLIARYDYDEHSRAAVYIVHVTCGLAADEVAAGQARGVDVSAETCLQYLTNTVQDLERPDFEGARYVCSPPLAMIQHRLVKLWEMGVAGGRLTASELVDMTSTAIARRFGLAGKGSIAPGMDADLVVFDPSTPFQFSTRTSHMNVDYDLFEGETSTGSVRHTLCRGTVVYDRGEILTQPGHGRFVARSLGAPAVAS